MKTRQGFVSNSSSSSFVCVVAKADHDAAFNMLTDAQKETLKGTFEDGEIGGLKIVAHGHMSDRGGYSSYSGGIYSESADFDWEEFDSAQTAYEKALKDAGAKTFEMGFDM